MSVICAYVTFSSQAEAKTICRSLIEKKLIACANIFADHTALYNWDNKFNEHPETAALMKTSATNVEKLVAEIKAQHSYDEPAIVTWNIDNGSPSYLDWINQQIR